MIRKVFHREFADDLKIYIGEHTDLFKTMGSDWNVSRAWVDELKIIRPESVFPQMRISIISLLSNGWRSRQIHFPDTF